MAARVIRRVRQADFDDREALCGDDHSRSRAHAARLAGCVAAAPRVGIIRTRMLGPSLTLQRCCPKYRTWDGDWLRPTWGKLRCHKLPPNSWMTRC